MKTIITLLVLLFSTGIWAKSTSIETVQDGSETIKMRIQSEKVSCDGSDSNTSCFMVQKGASIGTDFWEILPENIDGFNFESGFDYEVTIQIVLRDNPTEGQSRFQYKLIEVISKKKA